MTGLAAHLGLYRVRDWLHFLPLPLAGWVSLGPERSPAALFAGMAAWACALAYTSALNHAFDARVDRLRRGKNPVGGLFTAREAVLRAVPMGVAAFGLIWAFAPGGLPAVVMLLVTATLYSAPPRLKRWPVLGTLWNVLVGLPGLFFSGGASLSVSPVGLLVSAFSVLLVGSQLIHEAEDRDDDVQGGVSTVATVLGRRGALAAAALVLLTLPVVVFVMTPGMPAASALRGLAALFSLAWAGALTRRAAGDDDRSLRPMRLGYRWAALGCGALLFGLAIL